MNNFYSLLFKRGNRFVEFFVDESGLDANYSIVFPRSAPGAGQTLRFNGSNWEWFTPGTSDAAGTVTSVSVNLPNIFSTSVATATTTPEITATLVNQAPRTFFAGATSGTGSAPSFRSIVVDDLPTIPESKLGTLTEGTIPSIPWSKLTGSLPSNKMGVGTVGTSFIIGDGGANPISLRNNSGVLEVKNGDGSQFASIRIAQLFQESIDAVTIQSRTLEIGDNEILINAQLGDTAAPTVSGGLRVKRGSQPDALIRYNEGSDYWEIGTETGDIPKRIVRRLLGTFDSNSTNYAAGTGVVTVTHNLGVEKPSLKVYNGDGDEVNFSPTHTSVNALTFNVLRAGNPVVGTWTWIVEG